MDNSMSQEGKKKRRRRNDEQGRTHKCVCGKSYLSYPALYTHIKNKHNGKPSSKIDEPDERKEIQIQVQERNVMEAMSNFVAKYFPFPKSHNQQEYTFSVKDLPDQERKFIEKILNYWETHNCKDQHIQQNSTYSTTIDNVLGRFINISTPKLSPRGHKFMTWFVIALRKGICNIKQDDKYCQFNQAYGIPLLFNDLPLRYIPVFANQQQFLLNSTLVCKMLFYFGKWLFSEKYTNLSIKFNTI